MKIPHKILPYSLAAFSILWALAFISVIWYYQDDVFQTLYDPGEPFQTYEPPPTPDYNLDASWILRAEPIDLENPAPGGDVYVLGPTVFLGSTDWNAKLDNPKVARGFSRTVMPNYVLPFGLAGRLYAPKYREAALYAFMTNREDAQAAQGFAYQDARRAFESFLEQSRPERPLIIVGYGQGGLHVQRLLAEALPERDKARLAAAYIIDHPVLEQSMSTDLSGFPLCTSQDATGCIIAFTYFEEHENRRMRNFKTRTLVWADGQLIATDRQPTVCINPLHWRADASFGQARLHLGGVAAEGLDAETVPAPSPGQVSAQCQGGLLMISRPAQKSLRRPHIFGGKYRTMPSNLFYEDVRTDAARRVQNVLARGDLPRLAPPLGTRQVDIKDSPIAEPGLVITP